MGSIQYLIGKTLNKYKVLDHIGHGGMAEVYRGQHAQLDRMVAIKVLHPFLADEEGFVVRFQREAKIVATLRHPNIVQVYDFDRDRELDIYFMVMEYIDGPTLKSRLEDAHLTPEETARIGAAVADALDYAHRREMVHRDIKPANIMFIDGHQPVLTDFGIAKMLTLSGLTASGAMVGTPAYMAPEIGLGEQGTALSDIYSLSVVLYQAATGCLPFTAETPMGMVMQHINKMPPNPSLYNSDVPLELENAILRGLNKEPKERYGCAADLAAALRQAIGLPVANGIGDPPLTPSRFPLAEGYPDLGTHPSPTDDAPEGLVPMRANGDTPSKVVPAPALDARVASAGGRAGGSSPIAGPEASDVAPELATPGDLALGRRAFRTWPYLRTLLVIGMIVALSVLLWYTVANGVPPQVESLLFGASAAAPRPVETAPLKPTPAPTLTSTPPRLEPTATPPPAPAVEAVTPTPGCAIRVRLDNVDIQPSATVGPGATAVVYITLRNSGTCHWPSGAALVLAEGDPMGSPEGFPAASLAPGESMQFIVPIQAPQEIGTYQTVWELRKADGSSLGGGSSGRVGVDLLVEDMPVEEPTAPAALLFEEQEAQPLAVADSALLSWDLIPSRDVWMGTAQIAATGGTGVYAYYQGRISAETELPDGTLTFESRRCRPFPLDVWVLSGPEVLEWQGVIAYPEPEGCP